ncbi:uncharacterized protein EV420DRAFT_1235194, partial [Desarmillaria tabescens]
LLLPNRSYLRIHAACCRVARLSGAATYMETVLQKEEKMRAYVERVCNLAEDGLSTD